MHPFIKNGLWSVPDNRPQGFSNYNLSMKPQFKIGRFVSIMCLLFLFTVSGTSTLWATSQPVKKAGAAQKKANHQPQTVIQSADEAVVPVFSLKLQQQAFVTFERQFYIISDEKPRHPDTYPIFRSAFFANIFSNTIAINAP